MKLVMIHPLHGAPHITIKNITQWTAHYIFKDLNLRLNASTVETSIWQKNVKNQKGPTEIHLKFQTKPKHPCHI